MKDDEVLNIQQQQLLFEVSECLRNQGFEKSGLYCVEKFNQFESHIFPLESKSACKNLAILIGQFLCNFFLAKIATHPFSTIPFNIFYYLCLILWWLVCLIMCWRPFVTVVDNKCKHHVKRQWVKMNVLVTDIDWPFLIITLQQPIILSNILV